MTHLPPQPILPVPPHFDPKRAGEVWQVAYQMLAEQAQKWGEQQHIRPAAEDKFKLALLIIDYQNTFCIPGFELYVGGRSGTGAVDDSRRLAEFIYHNLGSITEISATLDTHLALQIFHAIFLVDNQGKHPGPYSLISVEDIERGRWKFNPSLSDALKVTPEFGQQHLLNYTRELRQRGKYDLTIWPYHAMLGGIGHALVSVIEEAIFFHSMIRSSQVNFKVKGQIPFTEHYSALGPEVLQGPDGKPIARKDREFIQKLAEVDALVIAGQAKSHCVAWTIDDLLAEIQTEDEGLARKVYLLEDCTSPVVVPGADYTEDAERAFQRFQDAGMHRVRSTDPISSWPEIAG